jgi:hypothetical protein
MCLTRRGNWRESCAKREQMRAVFRLGDLLLAGALALAPATALAQEAPPSDSNTPAADAIGPKALQSFSLNGTVTRPADQPPAEVPPTTQKRQPKTQAQVASPAVEPSVSLTDTAAPQTAHTPTPAPQRTASADIPRAAAPQPSPTPLQQSPASSSVTAALPTLDPASGTGSASAPAAATDFAPAPGTPESGRKFPILPWLLATLLLAAGGIFLFWRNQRREAFVGGPQVDAFVAPEPVPAPTPRPAPAPPAAPKPSPPAPVGIVSTRLRPWVDIGFQPMRCVLDDERVTVEFELELFNSGSGPARAVLVEATLFNAGPTQDQQIDGFFAKPVGEGERIVVIPPLKRVAIRTQVTAPRAQLQAYEFGGREVFVPIIAFNSLYSWGGGEGQTSVSYLFGKDTKGEKLAPFRLDLGPRIFRGLAAHLLPTGVRN